MNRNDATRLQPQPEDVTVAVPAAPSDAAAHQAAEAAVPLEWNEGDVILDLYEVKGLLGEGGMGKVYWVHHRGWNIDLAVKSPKPDILQRAEGVENFVREAETWVDLGLHPHSVTCHYVRTLGGIPRVFAEFVEGGSLSDWVRDRRLYDGGPEKTLERILDIAIQFAWGLHYAHEQDLIHQDVKPANVMMTPDGVAKVTDFGLAKARAAAGERGAVPPGQSLLASYGGRTPAYCSPEQADAAVQAEVGVPPERRPKLTRKTDIWSWGVSVLEMFVGEVTWLAGQVAAEALEGYLEMGPEGESIPAMPATLAELLGRCFQQEPADRPAGMEEVAAELEQIYQQEVGRPYLRQMPEAVELRADSLNNRALSLLDLGRMDAEAAWEAALEADPHHAEATYNLGLWRWRAAQQTDTETVQQMQAIVATQAKNWRPRYLLGLLHLERGDGEAAEMVLKEAAQLAPREREVQNALARVESANGYCLRKFKGHRRKVWAVAIAPDGRYALSGSFDKTLKLWDVASGKCLRTFEGHTGGVNSVCLSGDGHYALSGSIDKTLKLWDVASGRCLRTFEGHTGKVYSVCLSTDGRYALSGGGYRDEALKLWDVASGRCLRTFEGHTGGVYSVCLSTDGRYALSNSKDETLKLWDVASGKCLRVFEGHKIAPTTITITPDGRCAVSGSEDETMRLWDLARGRCLRTFSGQGTAYDVAVTPDGRYVISASDDGMWLWGLDGVGKILGQWAFSRPVTASQAGQAATEAKDEVEAARRALADDRLITAATALRRARSLPGYERDPEVLELWHQLGIHGGRRTGLLMGHLLHTLEGHTYLVNTVAAAPHGRYALSGSIDKTLKLWDVATGKCLRTFEGHKWPVKSVCLSADGHYALSGSHDKTLKLWDVASGKCLRTFEGHTSFVQAVAIGPDGRYALSGSIDKTLKLWDVASGKCLRTFEGHSGGVYSVCLSGDGRYALSGSHDETLKLWDVTRGRCLRTFEGHTEGVNSVCLSADGRYALSGGGYRDETLKLWDVTSGRCLRTLEGHTGGVNSVCLSADGRYAVSVSGDGTLKLWELTNGDCLHTFEELEALWANAVAVTLDGRYLVSGYEDNTLRLWELAWDYQFPEPADWDEGARPYLETFLTLHTPYSPDGISRVGAPTWTEEDFQQLLTELGYRGYGWLRPEGVRKELERMAQQRQGSQPLERLPTSQPETPAPPKSPAPESKGSWLSRLFGKDRK